jgi:adhesin transport system membrane fusion protein
MSAKKPSDAERSMRLASALQRPNPAAHVIMLLIACFFVIAWWWARSATLDEVTVGEGRVVPSGQVQVVQNLEGGIVVELAAKEGQVVDKDDILLRIDDTRFVSSYKESRAKQLALMAAAARLRAESEGRRPDFPEEIRRTRPDLVRIESELHRARAGTLAQALQALERSLAFAEQELAMTAPAVEKGAVSEVELLRLRRQVNELQGTIEDRKNRFRADAQGELTRTLAEMESLAEGNVASADRVKRTTVRAPVRGIVKRINVKTVGGVVQPGADILEIVPLEDTLVVEVRVRPSDIGFLRPDQPAMVKISAFDYSIYGGMPGKVEQISADTIDDVRQNVSYYRVLVRTATNVLEGRAGRYEIIPGMTATVDILTGKKTVLDYVLKPLIKAKDSALRER